METKYYGTLTKQCGFTLIELIITLLIIAIISSISIGTIVDTRSRTPRQIAKDIEQVFSLAQDEASITGTIKGLFIDSNNQIELRDYIREKNDEAGVAEAFSGLLNGIASVGLSNKDIEKNDSFIVLEDRGAFPPIEEANWSTLIYSLQLPEGYQLEKQVVAAVGGSLNSKPNDKKSPDSNLSNDDESTKEDADPLIRFFPDGSVQPGGNFTIFDSQQKIQLNWDTNGNTTLID